MIILDTNVLSELLRPDPAKEVERWLAAQDGPKIYFTTVGEAELRHGVAILPAGKRRNALSTAIEGLLEEDFRDRILPFDRPAARAYATIAAERRAAGRPISQFDCQIAAIARAREATVATRNTGDYEGCGIELINPWTFSTRKLAATTHLRCPPPHLSTTACVTGIWRTISASMMPSPCGAVSNPQNWPRSSSRLSG